LSEFGFLPTDDPNKPAPALRAGIDSSLGDGNDLQSGEGIFQSLWANLRDVFFPVKLPPLMLESKPIPVIDRMATKQDPKATATAFAIYGLLILLFVLWGARKIQTLQVQKQMNLTDVTAPPPMEVKKDLMGGGGGQKGPTPVVKGHLPKFADIQITPPKAPVLTKVQMPDPTIDVQKDLKMANNNMPNIGMPNSPVVGTSSMGNGSGSGLGSGNGPGMGPGSGGNYGGGLEHVGGGVSSPYTIYTVEPEFSEEARKAKFQGVVTVNLIVDANGRPQNVHILRGVGMGLDEKAVEAVKQYKFHPAMKNGKGVAVELNVEVDFQIF
jgi:protein TonB